jgi:ankyrin repeat protein
VFYNMNRLVRAVKDLDLPALTALLDKEPKWLTWAEPSGRNALHYLGGVIVGDDTARALRSVEVAALLLERGMDINAVHAIPDEGEVFLATPLWWAYAKGRNRALYTYLLQRGANPQGCMFAIAWNDVEAAALFRRHGAEIDPPFANETPFLAAYLWRRFEVAAWFLQHGAAVDHTDAHGNTALFHAIKRRYGVSQVQLLLRHGADPHHVNNDGVSPYDFATQNRMRKLLAVLTESRV